MVIVVWVLGAALAAPLGQALPVPQPFPKPAAPVGAQAPAPPAQPAAVPAPDAAAVPAVPAVPNEATLGVVVYPGAQFIASYNAGRNQRYYLFGTAASFAEIVTYYRTLLKQRGDQVYEVPATHQFDIGRFDNDTMAFPPSVTIKDFQSEVSPGFPNPKPGGEPARFPTIIQIVPPVSK
jgi:hypothetical protein